MKSGTKKKIFNAFRFVFKVGFFKTILICFAFLTADAEYKIRWKGHNVFLRKGTTDFTVFRQVLVFQHYELKALKNVHTIIDLGANIGLSTLYFKTKYPQASVIAIEPEQGNFDMLKKNVNGLPGVYCLRNAVWNRHKQLQLNATRYGEYGFSVQEETDAGPNRIESVTMDEIREMFAISKIDLLKIDIEGSEKELFSDNYLRWLPEVNCIIIELHDWVRPGCSSTFFRAVSTREFQMSGRGENLTILFDRNNETPVPSSGFAQSDTERT